MINIFHKNVNSLVCPGHQEKLPIVHGQLSIVGLRCLVTAQIAKLRILTHNATSVAGWVCKCVHS